MRAVILPKANESDLEGLPEAVKTALVFLLVDDVTAVIAHLFRSEDVQSHVLGGGGGGASRPALRGSKL